jgi:SAM-dependent methyltransferase
VKNVINSELTFDPESFKGLEYAGWQKGAASYDSLFGSVTRFAIASLLDATDVRAGSQVLEVCCGVGYGTGAALSRGAIAIGIDFAPAMVEAARRRYPNAVFRQGDAEALDLDPGAFDAVICAFGINHLQRPEIAIAEALRVLRPGGKYAFTMWCVPGKSKFHQLVLESIRTHGTLDVPLPRAPPPFRFSEPQTCTAALLEAGFIDPQVSEVPLAFRPSAPERVLELAYSAVRLEMILSSQTAEARDKIHRAIIDGAAQFRASGKIEIPMPAVLASAMRP